MAAATLVALAYVMGELGDALTGVMSGVLAKWEATITARLGRPAETGDAADNLRAATAARCTSDIERTAMRLMEAKAGAMSLISFQELPLVAAGAISVSKFPRLKKVADAHGAVPTSRLRALATKIRLGLPADLGGSQEGRALWVWRLAELERRITVRAYAWLSKTTKSGAWNEAVAALEANGRISADWMT